MKLPGNAGGSFGMPAEMKEAREKFEEQKNKEASAPVREENLSMEDSEEVDAEATSEEVSKSEQEVGYKQIFKRLGIEFTDKDIQQLIFKGAVTKDIEVVKTHLTATMKTLLTDEYDVIDEILSEESKAMDMSVDGYNARKSVLTLCFGVTHLQGSPLVKKTKLNEDGSVDLYALAAARRKVFKNMSATVLDMMIEIHGAFITGINAVLRDKEGVLKNS